ncbi:MAG: alpha/beta fold hydrolase [Burkholderiaceae bacterium]|nr:alpha/beta fold hydrolase [Microbacteriaceae bacterium]
MPHLEVNGATIYYETEGHPGKPAIILIHAGIATLRMWDPLTPALADDHYVIRYDTRGSGGTTADSVDFSDRTDARDILDHLGVATATVIGCSRGGGIAIDLALESPHRIAGLVTICSGPSGLPEVAPTDRENAAIDRLDRAFEAGDWARLNELEVRLWALGTGRDPATLDPGFVELAYELNRPNLEHADEHPTPAPLDPPAFDRLVDITVPTLVTVGDHDLTEVLAAFEFLITSIPHADSARFADSAHLPSVEQADVFSRTLADWLAHHGL